jgi:hypothetical protein
MIEGTLFFSCFPRDEWRRHEVGIQRLLALEPTLQRAITRMADNPDPKSNEGTKRWIPLSIWMKERAPNTITLRGQGDAAMRRIMRARGLSIYAQ